MSHQRQATKRHKMLTILEMSVCKFTSTLDECKLENEGHKFEVNFK